MSSRIFKKKRTGGRCHPYRRKRKRELPGSSFEAKSGEEESRRRIRTRGGDVKIKLVTSQYANVSDPKKGKTKKVKILEVVSNPASREHDRKKVITRGAIVRTKLGLAKVTSRPGQDGTLNAILVKAAKA